MSICRRTLWLLPFFIIYFTVVVNFLIPTMVSGKSAVMINCDIQQDKCVQQTAGGSVSLEILPRPVKAMETLTFRVHVTGISLEGLPRIDLGMPGMTMGPNQVVLTKTGSGEYQGSGVIVRCPSGKTIWEATVHLPGNKSTSFIFDVIY